MNLFFLFLLSSCPWLNLLYTWSLSYKNQDKTNIWASSVLLGSELTLQFLYLYFDEPIFMLLNLVVFFISFIYAIRLFYSDYEDQAPKLVLSSLMLIFISSFTFIANVILVFRVDYKQNRLWFIYVIFLIILNFLPSQFQVIQIALTMGNIIFYVLSNRDPLSMDELNSFLRRKKNIPVINNVTNVPLENVGSVGYNSANNQLRNNNIHEVDSSLQYSTYERGWSVDDTTNLDVNILTIEDVIFPIALKNEYEKVTKELIIYIRKLNRYEDNEIQKTFGEDGLSSYLNVFFSKLKLDELRYAYKKSLYLIIEDYSNRDERVKIYLRDVIVEPKAELDVI